MINRVVLFGHLGQKPSVFQNGCRFEIASNERWINKAGVECERTVWHPCSIFGPKADTFAKLGETGAGVIVDGKLTNNPMMSDSGYVNDYRVVVERFFFTEKRKKEIKEDEEDFDEFKFNS